MKKAGNVYQYSCNFLWKASNSDDQKIYCPRTPASSTESHFFYEILIVHLDFPKKNVFNGHLVVSGKSVSI